MELLVSILIFPFLIAFNGIRGPLEEIDLSTNKREKITNAIPLLPAFAAILMFVYSIITFIIGHGYSTQINLIKTVGFGKAIKSIWTLGTVLNFYQPWFIIAISVVFVAMNVIAIIDVLATERIRTKVGCIFCLIITLLFASPILMELIKEGSITQPIDKKLGLGSEFIHLILIVLAIVAIITAIFYFKILCDKEYFVSAIINTVACFLVYPLVCWLVENVFGLIFAVVIAGVALIIAAIAGVTLFSGPSYSGGSSSSHGGGGSSSYSSSSDIKSDTKVEHNRKLVDERKRYEEERVKLRKQYEESAKDNFNSSVSIYGKHKEDFERELRKIDEEIKRIDRNMEE